MKRLGIVTALLALLVVMGFAVPMVQAKTPLPPELVIVAGDTFAMQLAKVDLGAAVQGLPRTMFNAAQVWVMVCYTQDGGAAAFYTDWMDRIGQTPRLTAAKLYLAQYGLHYP